MPSVDVVLKLSAEACLAHYQGRVGQVLAMSLDGRRVAFPAEALRHVVSRDGVHGVFRLCFTPEGRFRSIARLDRFA
ncbi:DUF2835 domain-containing protein [Halomonas sp. MCCC 1A17488]|uniref:DUF2835 domain-containing protein n=1 Tax=Billgrantia sulfidoxydans TaxID=2733484 RepID=A0ABX7W730_9GAMM|nr:MULTISPECIES: DUF2835 domain-containing protein [Halomonas]MCE8014851.1 DUF2835 domain-containing protein [Halomonas sp. MCCC 1A17488]MCG3238184.1 DUF2835 domain-containing protein [Halomonas sp. MCCC 1A17488]QPP48049.1 DUF2835 domain-containing protein [Halomonas sp. SS10-MC5]QTP55357.1 DUF2835 domain-containing protein [Halomonas sulfidoxydans]